MIINIYNFLFFNEQRQKFGVDNTAQQSGIEKVYSLTNIFTYATKGFYIFIGGNLYFDKAF